jgi:alkylation response protein AidB-like acyl-CoA dehydrogenase
MDLRFSEEYEAYRRELRDFLEANWPLRGDEAALPADQQQQLFRERATQAGYYLRGVPRRYGGSEQPADVLKGSIIDEEVERAGAPPEIRSAGLAMLVPTLLQHGSEEQCDRFIPPVLSDEVTWCQGYSEPGSGSDLASLQTRAELVGDEWVINGQKIWTSGAHEADWMFCLCRTEPDAPKHGGISYILIDMRTPGIEVRPMRQMTGTEDFNQVFFTDVHVPAENIVGRRGEGWKVANSTLQHERNMIGDASYHEVLFENLLKLARERTRDGRPALEDPHVRQQMAEIEAEALAHRFSVYRQLTDNVHGRSSGIVPLMNKLNTTELALKTTALALELLDDDGLQAPGTEGTLMGASPKGSAGWVSQGMWSLGLHIGGGTAHIQRNIIAELGLGLPREPRPKP